MENNKIVNNTVGIIGRFKPLHNGNYELLKKACESFKQVIIAIGSSNKYDYRNPFTAEETEQIIKLALNKYSNFKIIFLPDFGHIPEFRDGKKWKENLIKSFGKIDYLISGNAYVNDLLKDTYKIINAFSFVPNDKKMMINSSTVRLKMAKDEDWQPLVPKEVQDYLIKNKLIDRFKREFSKETIEKSDINFNKGIKQEEGYVRNIK